jgi:asparaginyl-tRNA synthetase
LEVRGKLELTPQRVQICELKVQEIELVNSAAVDYPLQKQAIPLEAVRKYLHLRAKTNFFLTILRLRHGASKAIHDFFGQQGFY